MATFKVTQVVWLLLVLLEAVLALRVVFKLIGVNAANPFATLLYNLTYLFVFPFASLVKPLAFDRFVFETSTIIAMIVYLLMAWALERIIYVLFYRPRGPVSVSQTSVAEHTPQPMPLGVSQTTTTERTTPLAPTGTSQTTVTQSTNTPQTPGTL